LAGGLNYATSQQAELSALISILHEVPVDISLHVLLDSQYSLKSATIWIPQWKTRGWRKSDGKPVLNLDLMKELDEAMNLRTTRATMEWVPGHTGHPLNEHADRRCG
jgi:ribonuclease HI